MALTAPEFVARLSSGVPGCSTILREHLDQQEGELLLHLLVADLRRLARLVRRRQDRRGLREGSCMSFKQPPDGRRVAFASVGSCMAIDETPSSRALYPGAGTCAR